MNEIIALLEVKRRTVERWIAKGKFPAPIKVGNTIYFPLDALLKWPKAQGEELASEFKRLAMSRAHAREANHARMRRQA
jgi:excisionase family DNA binding protein